jgi:hypothetical protein
MCHMRRRIHVAKCKTLLTVGRGADTGMPGTRAHSRDLLRDAVQVAWFGEGVGYILLRTLQVALPTLIKIYKLST